MNSAAAHTLGLERRLSESARCHRCGEVIVVRSGYVEIVPESLARMLVRKITKRARRITSHIAIWCPRCGAGQTFEGVVTKVGELNAWRFARWFAKDRGTHEKIELLIQGGRK